MEIKCGDNELTLCLTPLDLDSKLVYAPCYMDAGRAFEVSRGISFCKDRICDMEGSQYNRVRIWDSKIDGCNMRSIDFRDCSFFGSSFFNTDFEGTRFEKIDVANSVTVKGYFVNCRFASNKIDDGDLENCDFVDCLITNLHIRNSIVDSCHFRDCKVGNVTATGMTFIGVVFEGSAGSASFKDCTFMNCTFTDKSKLNNYSFVDCIEDGKPFVK